MQPDEFQAELDKQHADQQATNDKQQELAAITKAGIKNVEATNATTQAVKTGLKDVRGKVEITNQLDTSSMVDAIHKMNVTAFMQNQGLPELTDNLVKLTEGVKLLRNEYESKGTGETAKQLTALVDKLDTVSKELGSAKVEVDADFKQLVSNLLNEIKAIDFKPSVSVAAAKVTVPKVDTSGIERILSDFTSKEDVDKVDLDDYYAQDLDEMEPGIQYVGFVNPKGNWYIIKNTEAENKLRYAFGDDAYKDFFARASQLEYKLLNEALHAV